MLNDVHAEISRQIKNSGEISYKDPDTGEWVYKGPNPREFKRFVKERLESAGWTPANPSHIETIYRTNIRTAYSSGEFVELTQPDVLAARPYWQIVTVRDSRQRKSHRKAHGIVLPADHPFWRTCYPPFGYNCRCGVVSRSKKWVEKHGGVSEPPMDLPDPGFDSGTQSLLVPKPAHGVKRAPKADPAADTDPFNEIPGPPATLPSAAPFDDFDVQPIEVEADPDPYPDPLPELSVPPTLAPKPSAKPAPLPAAAAAKRAARETVRKAQAAAAMPKPVDILREQLGGATGSNPGGMYKGSDGNLRYVKFYSDPAQAAGEHLANQVYKDLGVDAASSTLFQHEGKLAFASDFVMGVPLRYDNNRDVALKALDGFVGDLLLGNWDAAGLSLDNIVMTPDGKLVRIDNGGALLHRAQGKRKDFDALLQLSEWDTMFDRAHNPGYAALAERAGVKSAADLKASIRRSAKRLEDLEKSLGDAGWSGYVEKHAPTLSDSDQYRVAVMLRTRSQLIRERVRELLGPARKAAYRAPKRAAVSLKSYPTQLEKALAVETRHGRTLAQDSDWIEGFGVTYTRETLDGVDYTIARFKVTAQREAEMARAMEAFGATESEYSYLALDDLTSPRLRKLSANREYKKPPGSAVSSAKVDGAEIFWMRSENTGWGELAATHNLAEVRVPTTKAREALAQVESIMGKIGIDATPPTEEARRRYLRAKILSTVTSQGRDDLRGFGGNVDLAWSNAVARDPSIADLEAEVELRDVGNGHFAPYSAKLAARYKAAGVKALVHRSGAGVEVLEQMLIHDPGGGLLSSRERFQRGTIFRGASTNRDFETGGADNVFTRLSTKKPEAPSIGWTFDIDPSEMGRLDSYFYNGDLFGRAGTNTPRRTTDEIERLVREKELQSDNEFMLQRQVALRSVRRILTNPGNRSDLLRALDAAGVKEINGIPVGDFIVSDSK
jgi:SPP1 gp7 family putative phage head morphogenesis protein